MQTTSPTKAAAFRAVIKMEESKLAEDMASFVSRYVRSNDASRAIETMGSLMRRHYEILSSSIDSTMRPIERMKVRVARMEGIFIGASALALTILCAHFVLSLLRAGA